MHKPSRLPSRLERLERRRLLSGEHGDGAELANEVHIDDWREPTPQLVPWASKKLFGPMPRADGMIAQGVVGGTASMSRQPAGALTGKTVFTVGGHGFVAFTGGWHTQRGEVAGTEMNEDTGNQDQMTFYVNHLWNAGATVVPLRPVGYQPVEYILDNDDAGVTFTGSWSNSVSTHFYGSPGDAVPYRFASTSATQTAVAKFTPNIAAAGFYPVYAWTRHGSDRVNQLYKVTHAGGTTEVRVNHRRVGNGYVYLGWYYFNAGTGGFVEISNQSNESGVVIADHIRFGNGMGDIDRGLGVSQQTRSDESALYWIEHQRGQGVSDTEFRGPGAPDTDDTDNVSAPPRWAEWMNREAEGTNTERIFLSFHSNAGSGSSRGTVGLYNGNNDPATKTPHQFEWAQLVGKETNDDMVALGNAGEIEHTWSNRTNPTLDRSDIEFGEINNTVINNEFDATILEVAFHDNVTDAELMRDPKVRDWVARASLQATIKYFRQFNSQPTLALPPDAPTNVRAVVQPNGDVTVSWAAPVVDAIGGEAATGYIVYTSPNGYAFNTGTLVAGGGTLSLTVPAGQLNGATYFRVAATNAGGESMVSETVAARAGASSGRFLIVQGFDRLARQQNPTFTSPLSYDPPFTPGTGSTVDRVRPRFSNSFDYIVRAGEALKSYPTAVAFDSTSNEALIAGQVSLSGYHGVIWLAGEESTADETFGATEQTLITNYLNAGGKLFVSGAEIGFDLDASAGGVSFYNNQLKADYVADSAGGYTASGSAGSIFAGISLTFDNGSSGTYNVNSPDRINAFGGSTVAFVYTSPGSGNAAVQYASGSTRVVHLAFPFETITTESNRNSVMHAVLGYFGLGLPALSGRIFRDIDGDDVQDAAETTVLAGRTVFLDTDNDFVLDPGETSTVTDVNGDYLFNSMLPGTYNVRVPFISGYVATVLQTKVVTVGGTNSTGNDFGFFPTTYNGSGANDQYLLRRDPVDNSRTQIIETLGAGAPTTHSIASTRLSGLVFTTSSGDDTLTVEVANGNPVPSGGIQFNGSVDVDTLVLAGTNTSDTFAVAGSSATWGGTINHSFTENIVVNAGAGDDVLHYDGPVSANVTFNGASSIGNDYMFVNSGTYTFNGDAGTTTDKLQLNVAPAGNVVFNSTQHLYGLLVNGAATLSAGGAKVLVTHFLTIGGSLDLTDNDLVLDYFNEQSPLASIFDYLADGYAGGTWNGATGIRTSMANPNGLTGLGSGEASQVFGLANFDTALFSGETVDATSVLVKFTYTGDAELDGDLDGDDYFWIDSHIALQTPGYSFGDFDYDGDIDGDDYFWIDGNSAQAQGNPL